MFAVLTIVCQHSTALQKVHTQRGAQSVGEPPCGTNSGRIPEEGEYIIGVSNVGGDEEVALQCSKCFFGRIVYPPLRSVCLCRKFDLREVAHIRWWMRLQLEVVA